MPSYPPRSNPIKKQQELAKRENELLLGIKRNVLADKLIKYADKYKKAQLSLLKAKIHHIKENEFQRKPNNMEIEQLEKQIAEWAGKDHRYYYYGSKKINS